MVMFNMCRVHKEATVAYKPFGFGISLYGSMGYYVAHDIKHKHIASLYTDKSFEFQFHPTPPLSLYSTLSLPPPSLPFE